MPEAPDYLTTGEVAARYRVTPSTVRRWVHAGHLHATTTFGGHHRFTEADLTALGTAPEEG